MTKEELKALGLTDEQTASIIEDYGKNYVSKPQFNAKNEELKELKNEIGILKKANKDNEELNAKLTELQTKAKEQEEAYKTKLNQITLDNAVASAVKDLRGRNVNAIKPLLKLEDVTIEDGKIKGLQEQLNALKESDGYLFESDEPKQPTPKFEGVNPGQTVKTSHDGITKEQFNSMSLDERTELYNTNQELYKTLVD